MLSKSGTTLELMDKPVRLERWGEAATGFTERNPRAQAPTLFRARHVPGSDETYEGYVVLAFQIHNRKN